MLGQQAGLEVVQLDLGGGDVVGRRGDLADELRAEIDRADRLTERADAMLARVRESIAG